MISRDGANNRNEGSLIFLPGATSETFSAFPELTSIEQSALPSHVGHAHPAPSFPILPLFMMAKRYEHSTKGNPSYRIPEPSGCSSAFKDGAALKRGAARGDRKASVVQNCL